MTEREAQRAKFKEATRAARAAHKLGLGDMVAIIPTALGIKPCGKCKKRQAWLNELGKKVGIG